ncbi:PEP-CTERM system histidine kinase PrsK [Salinisphaera aquimarina]
MCLTLLLVAMAASNGWLQLLMVACAANALWCFLLVTAPSLGLGGPVLDAGETLRDGAWLVLVASLLPRRRASWAAGIRRAFTLVLPALLTAFVIWRLLTTRTFGPVTLHHSYVFACGATAMSLWGMVMLEQVYRSASESARWGLKYLCLAVGTLFLYDFLMYSYALLSEHINIGVWNARGAVNALVAPLIGLAIMRAATWSPRLRLSHRAAFRTGVLTLGGGYLLIMAIGSYYIRNFGGDWGKVIAVLFLAAMSLLFLIVLLSGRARAYSRVQINKHFFHYKYDYREEWLALTRRLSQSTEVADPYERAIRAVAQLLESPAGALWLERSGEFACVSHWNMPEATEVGEPGDTSFAEFLRDRQWIIDLSEYEGHPAHYGGLQLPEWIKDIRRAGLIMPLYSERTLLGFMLIASSRTAIALTWEDLDLLKTLGRQIGVFLDQQESNQALAQSRQFEAVNRLTAFLMHDLKNIAAQQSLVIQNAPRHKHNPAFIDDMILTVESSVERLKGLLDQLQRASSNQDNTRRVVIDQAVATVVESLVGTNPEPTLSGSACGAIVHVDPEKFSMVLKHIVRNAQEATASDGKVDVNVEGDAETVRVRISDNGSGMTREFVRESLFRPFFTTKSARGMGIGAYQARDFARAAGGDVIVESEPGRGTVFTIVLPLTPAANRGINAPDVEASSA